MTKHTTRDRVWNQALQFAMSGKEFRLDQIQMAISEDVSDRTVRDTLNTMVDHGWLSKEAVRSHSWMPGPKAEGENINPGQIASEASSGRDSGKDINSVASISKGQTYFGKVDRFSGDNAIVSTDYSGVDLGHINLGPISKAADGSTVVFRYLGGVWGRCLDEEYTPPRYDPKKQGSNNSGDSRSKANTASQPDSDWDSRKREIRSNVSSSYD